MSYDSEYIILDFFKALFYSFWLSVGKFNLKFCQILHDHEIDFSICFRRKLLEHSTHQRGYFHRVKIMSNFREMRFCTANKLQSDNMSIQILLTPPSYNRYWGEAIVYTLIRRMRKMGEKWKSRKESVWWIFEEKRRERWFCTFSLSLLVLHLLWYYVY